MKYYVLIILAGLIGLLYGCASTIDALSNNTSGDMLRGVKLQAGVDASSGNPVPSVSFKMGSIARKGKSDRTVVLIDNNTTDIVSENYDITVDYENVGTNTSKPRQLLKKEKRESKGKQFEEGIFVYQKSSFGMGVTAGNLFSAGGGTMVSIGKVGQNIPVAIMNAKTKEGIYQYGPAVTRAAVNPVGTSTIGSLVGTSTAGP
ncbi:MAG: hypothetical protein ACE5KZ_12545 [Candidatus Scalinduaceae bacterium]